MTKAFIAIIIAIVVIGGGIALFGGDKDDKASTTNTSQQSSSSQSATQGTDTTKAIAKEDVAKHSIKDDCWTIISGKVYDISAYVPNHPGGDEILRACGTDGTSLFTTRTTTDGKKVGSGTPHSSSAANILSKYLLGPLAS